MKREQKYLDRMDNAIVLLEKLPPEKMASTFLVVCPLHGAFGSLVPKAILADQDCGHCALGWMGAWCLASGDIITEVELLRSGYEDLVDVYELITGFYGLTGTERNRIYETNDDTKGLVERKEKVLALLHKLRDGVEVL